MTEFDVTDGFRVVSLHPRLPFCYGPQDYAWLAYFPTHFASATLRCPSHSRVASAGSHTPHRVPRATEDPQLPQVSQVTSGLFCGRMDSAWISSRFPKKINYVESFRSYSWGSARRLLACRVVSRRAGAARIARVGVLRRCAGVFGAVLQTPLLR